VFLLSRPAALLRCYIHVYIYTKYKHIRYQNVLEKRNRNGNVTTKVCFCKVGFLENLGVCLCAGRGGMDGWLCTYSLLLHCVGLAELLRSIWLLSRQLDEALPAEWVGLPPPSVRAIAEGISQSVQHLPRSHGNAWETLASNVSADGPPDCQHFLGFGLLTIHGAMDLGMIRPPSFRPGNTQKRITAERADAILRKVSADTAGPFSFVGILRLDHRI
jgi:hypothetical protein